MIRNIFKGIINLINKVNENEKRLDKLEKQLKSIEANILLLEEERNLLYRSIAENLNDEFIDLEIPLINKQKDFGKN